MRRRNHSPDDWSERVKAWVERSCAEQGVPVKVSEPLVLRQVADILNEAREARAERIELANGLRTARSNSHAGAFAGSLDEGR